MTEIKKELIEKLELLAAFYTLSAKNAGEQAQAAHDKGNQRLSSFSAGRQAAYEVAFQKIDIIIKEAKK